MAHPIVQELEKSQMKKTVPEFCVGDMVEVRMKVKEGDKERLTVFIGTVIGRQGGSLRETFTVRRLVQGEGVERVFPLHSPLLTDVRVRHKGEVRRAKLYYLRRRVGKATRIKGRTVHEVASSEAHPAPEPEPVAAKPAQAAAPAKPAQAAAPAKPAQAAAPAKPAQAQAVAPAKPAQAAAPAKPAEGAAPAKPA